jgi:hypothetical protein
VSVAQIAGQPSTAGPRPARGCCFARSRSFVLVRSLWPMTCSRFVMTSEARHLLLAPLSTRYATSHARTHDSCRVSGVVSSPRRDPAQSTSFLIWPCPALACCSATTDSRGGCPISATTHVPGASILVAEAFAQPSPHKTGGPMGRTSSRSQDTKKRITFPPNRHVPPTRRSFFGVSG